MPQNTDKLFVHKECREQHFTGAHMLITDWAALAGVALFALGLWGRKLRSGK